MTADCTGVIWTPLVRRLSPTLIPSMSLMVIVGHNDYYPGGKSVINNQVIRAVETSHSDTISYSIEPMLFNNALN